MRHPHSKETLDVSVPEIQEQIVETIPLKRIPERSVEEIGGSVRSADT